MESQQELPDYDLVADELERKQLHVDVAECHGSMCGFLCASGDVEPGAWVARVLIEIIEDDELSPHGKSSMPREFAAFEDTDLLPQLYYTSATQLDDPQFGFHLLLPDDEEALSVRAEALASWCQGFLFGLTAAGLQDFTSLPAEAGEVLRDIVEITRLGHESHVDENKDEAAFMEIEEYIRMGVLLLKNELGQMGASPDQPVLH
jgi:uncharacterized protein YgfB (UPF0149 family)